MTEKEYGTLSFGRVICLLVGIFGFISFFSSIFLPESLQHIILTNDYLNDYGNYIWHFRFTNISFIIFKILSVGLIAFFYLIVRPKNFALVFFISLLSAYGSFLGAVYHLKLTMYVDQLYIAYQTADQVVQTILLTVGLPNYDQRIFISGLPALWWFVVSFLAITNQVIPRKLIVLGFSISATLVAYIILFYLEQVSGLKWVFLMYAALITIWSILEFRFLSRVLNKRNSVIETE